MKLRALLRIDRLSVILLCVSVCCVLGGCVESSFALANDSKLPRWFTLPSGLAREDVSVKLSYYTMGSATLILEDRKHAKLSKIHAKVENSYPLRLRLAPGGFPRGYPTYSVVVVNGIAEIIEHQRPEPIFYVNDDPAVRKELLESIKDRSKGDWK